MSQHVFQSWWRGDIRLFLPGTGVISKASSSIRFEILRVDLVIMDKDAVRLTLDTAVLMQCNRPE